ncbi:MAG: hypothetical protein JWO15_3738 [Sphingomonadales bacterium]|nr:hypothetical protein [Sphingomonadales bacterium]
MQVTCACGRVCASRSGFATHARKCEAEKARSAAVVAEGERMTRERLAEQRR